MINTRTVTVIECNGEDCIATFGDADEGFYVFSSAKDADESQASGEHDWYMEIENEHYCEDCQVCCANDDCYVMYPMHLDKCPECGTAKGEAGT